MPTDFALSCLRAHRVFHTRDLDESREMTSRMWERHRVSMPGNSPFETTIFGVSRAGMGVSYVHCKAPLLMECGPVGGNFYLYLPLEGEVAHKVNGRQAVGNSVTGVLHGPGQTVRMDATPVHMLMVSFDQSLLMGFLRALGLPTVSLEQWGLSIDLKAPHGRELAQTVHQAARDLDSESAPLALEAPFAQLRANICGHLVAALAEVAPDWSPTHDAWLGTCSVDDLTEWLRANIASPVGLADLVARSGVTPRAVQKAFMRHFGCGPKRFIADLRLDEAQRRIVANPEVPIIDLVTELGYGNAGRFAAEYARRFGEYPRETRSRWAG